MRYSDLNSDRNSNYYGASNAGQLYNPSKRRSGRKRKCRRAMQRRALFLFTIGIVTFLFLTVGVLHSSAGSEQEHKFKYYTSVVIEEGDTLWTIADQYMDNSIQGKIAYINEVKSINHIHDGDRIIAGKMLIVPYYSTEYITD